MASSLFGKDKESKQSDVIYLINNENICWIIIPPAHLVKKLKIIDLLLDN